MPHKLDIDTLITKALLQRLRLEAEYETGAMDGFWAVLEKNLAGDFITHNELTGDPLADQQMVAFDLVTRLNREHHDGAWLAAWTHPAPLQKIEDAARGVAYRRFVIMWMDGDGDIQFTIECEGTIDEIMLKGILHWQEVAEKAWDQWHHHMRVVPEIKPGQGETFQRAKGQNAPSSTLRH